MLLVFEKKKVHKFGSHTHVDSLSPSPSLLWQLDNITISVIKIDPLLFDLAIMYIELQGGREGAFEAKRVVDIHPDRVQT